MKIFLIFFAGLILSLYSYANPNLPQYEGVVAFQNGDYQTALRELQPLSLKGNSDAQHVMGVLYQNGLSVTQITNWHATILLQPQNKK